MKIEKKYSQIAVKYTYDEMIAAGVELDAAMLESFKSGLRGMAATRNYEEGQQLAPEDVNLIKGNIRVLINGAINNHDASLDFVKEDTSPHRFIFGAYCYLTALAMDTLNCPELPKDMGKDLLATATRRLIDTKPPRQSAEEYFNKQRRKDFVDISGGIMKLIDTVGKNAKDHKSLAELYGQYRALAQRQANHNGIWRFFHREENKNRNDLLKAMEFSLKQRGVVDLTKEPTDIYRDSMYSDYMKRIDTLCEITEEEPENAYGYYEYKNNPEPFAAHQEQPEQVQEQPEQVQEQQEPNLDQEKLIERLTGDLAENSTERLSKIDDPESQVRAKTFN